MKITKITFFDVQQNARYGLLILLTTKEHFNINQDNDHGIRLHESRCLATILTTSSQSNMLFFFSNYNQYKNIEENKTLCQKKSHFVFPQIWWLALGPWQLPDNHQRINVYTSNDTHLHIIRTQLWLYQYKKLQDLYLLCHTSLRQGSGESH